MDMLANLAAKEEISIEDVKLISQFSKQDIRDWLKSYQEARLAVKNLELLLTLHENDQLQITTYLHFCEDEASFVDLLVAYVASSSEEKLSMASDVLSILIPFQSDLLATKKYCTVLHHFVARVWQECTRLAPLVQHLSRSPYRIPFKLHDFLEFFIHEALDAYVPVQSKETYISNQRNLFVTLHDDPYYQFFEEVFKVLPSHTAYIIEEKDPIGSAIWPVDMTLVSAFLNSSPHNARWLLEYVEEGFKSALKNQEEDKTTDALLLIRQCCLEQQKPAYASYAVWFSNLLIKVKDEFEFFFSVLSTMVPSENPLYLKIHINKAPHIPASCHSVYSDYSQLARTQLRDLNETTEYLGLFGTTELEDRRQDVLRVLALHREAGAGGAVPPLLHKACVFRREYYTGVFLPDLLGAPLQDAALSQARASLVEALRAAGKMPPALYEAWPLKPAPAPSL